MPELPEVHHTLERVRPWMSGRTIARFEAAWARQIRPSIDAVRAAVVGRTVTHALRRAKFMVFELDDGSAMLVHLGMSGRMERTEADRPEPGHVRARWQMAGGEEVLFCDARKFGRIAHVARWQAALDHLGVEPLSPDFTPEALARALSGRRAAIKGLLLNQTVVAGLGNIYADESLFRAGVHPLTPGDALDDARVAALTRAIVDTLQRAIDLCGTSLDWVYPGGQMQTHLQVYGRGGQPCGHCARPISVIKLAQRSTHFCPDCQTLGP